MNSSYEVAGDLKVISSNMIVYAIFEDNGKQIKERMTHTAKLRNYQYTKTFEETICFLYSYVSDIGYGFESPLNASNFTRFEVNLIENKNEVQTKLNTSNYKKLYLIQKINNCLNILDGYKEPNSMREILTEIRESVLNE